MDDELKKQKAREYAKQYRQENKEKVNQMQRRWRANNKDMASEQRRRKYLNNIDREKEYTKKQFQEKREYYYKKRQEYKESLIQWVHNMKKEKGCKLCGTKEKLEYHHINPHTKVKTISQMTTMLKNKEEILEEIKKCEVLCVYCHRHTHTINGKPRKKKEKLD